MLCPSCSRENPDDANFCANCATPLRAEHGRKERKVVTVVFCDLVGFTGRAESMDPEDVRALLTPYHARLRTELERFGGTVEKFIGDAVVAVFGAPAAHEDDPERAVLAALAIRDWAREQREIEVRIAVNTGEALVSLGVDPARGEGMVAGDVINTAARIQTAAPVNGILVGEQTYRATRDAIVYADHDPLAAKGKAEPVAVREAVDAHARDGVDVEPQPRAKFVGRERELALLREAFARARDEREPQFVTLVAVPGAGKSRLVYELSRIVDADPELVCWRQGRCLPYGEGVSFWALAEIVKAETGILESDTPDAATAKLTASVGNLLPPGDAGWVERRLRPLVGLGEKDRAHGAREEAFPAWRRFLEAIAERGTSVLVVEDLHWADEGLLDFLDELAEWTSGLPLLIVGTARPELLAQRPGWGGGKTNAVTLSLPPLSEHDTARLVQNLLERTVLEADVQRALLDRAGGNPLYAEEFARMLVERGQGELAIPETVQGIIAARLDGLEPAAKRLLQDASVLGAVFWTGAVADLGEIERPDAERTLRELERREFVRRERRSTVEAETEYAFRHVLVRDVAYGQIPRAERSDRHRRAAEWIASLGRPDDHAELLAHHYLEAITYARAAGLEIAELAEPARTALREAGDRALGLAAYRQAARFFNAALELVEDGPERAELLFRSGSAQFWSDSTGEEVLAEAVAQLRDLDRSETAARAALLLARSAWARGDREAVDTWLAEVDRLIADLPDSVVQLEALIARSGFHMVAGEHERAIAAAREALPRLDSLDRPDLRARALDVIGSSRSGNGDERGLDDQRRAIEIARKGRALWELHHAVNNLVVAEVRFGRLHEMDELLEEWRTILEDTGGTHYNRSWFLVAQAWSDYANGRWHDALDSIDRFLASLQEGSTHYLEPEARSTRAMISFARGHGADAQADFERALTVAQRSGDPQILAPSLCLRATLLAAEGQTVDAVVDFDRLLAIGEPLFGALNGSGKLPAFAWLALDLNRQADAETVVDDATFPRWTAVARAILALDPAEAADLLAQIGDQPSEAYARLRAGGEHIHHALSFYKSVGATRYIHEAQTLLAASA
jgi:class 3 adenylate cyclase/tetratricopeptide (TPR) repeat protein